MYVQATMKSLILACLAAIALCHPAQYSQKQAMQRANEGKLNDALPFFKKACRLAPREANYWNNLGVTQLRLGLLEEAEAAFLAALQMQSSHPDATDNLRDTRGYMRSKGIPTREGQGSVAMDELRSIALGDDDLGDEVAAAVKSPAPPQAAKSFLSSPVALSYDQFIKSRGIRHRVRRLPRIHIDDWWKPENARFWRGQAPFVLLGTVANASALELLGSPSFYTQGVFAGDTADFYPANMDEKDVRPFLVPLSRAVAELLKPSGDFPMPNDRHPGRYIHLNMRWDQWQAMMRLLHPLRIPPMMDSVDQWISAAFDSDKERSEFQTTSHWRMLLIGTSGAGMFNHQDTLKTASYQLQLAGTKTWHICHPDQSPHLSPDHDMFQPDYERFPAALQADCVLEMVSAGEMIFYPADYWHQTLNTPKATGQLSIGFTDTLADWSNHHLIKRGLLANCAKPKIENITPSAALCEKFPRIFDFWERAYGTAGAAQLHEAHRLAQAAASSGEASSTSSAAAVAADGSVAVSQPAGAAASGAAASFVPLQAAVTVPSWRTCDMGACDSLAL